MAADPCASCAMFHSIRIAPAVGPDTVTNKSWISMEPVSALLPTTTTGIGLETSPNIYKDVSLAA